MSTTTLVLASNNPGKLAEFRQLLAPLGWVLVPQRELGIVEAEEPYPTFVENALAKARHASRTSGLPALADDSGLCVPALGGAPGVCSARYAGEPKSDVRNNAKLLAALPDKGDRAHRRAYYHAVLVLLLQADDPCPLITEGRLEGEIAREPAGHNGFGYDPLFYLPEQHCTAAELSAEEKNRISHRSQASAALCNQLRQRNG